MAKLGEDPPDLAILSKQRYLMTEPFQIYNDTALATLENRTRMPWNGVASLTGEGKVLQFAWRDASRTWQKERGAHGPRIEAG
jgi:hypothetical protein